MADVLLSLRNIIKSFGDVSVLRNVDLDIYRGEFFTLLGPSGCGKTTTLRIIAGLETPDEGGIFLNDAEITGLDPNKRNVNTVFQKYALFPYYNVFENVAYGLRIRKVPPGELNERVREALRITRMDGYAERMPNALSGGQQQRVAMARAIVNRPDALLLDEPLGALDLKLRRQMQQELKYLQKSLGITFIYVTHDQDEALTMSDRVGIMRDGKFEQIGSPQDIYNNPVSEFVADFVGETNLFTARVLHRTGPCAYHLELPFGTIDTKINRDFEEGAELRISIRPEHIRYSLTYDPLLSSIKLRGIIQARIFHGATIQTILQLADGTEFIALEIQRNQSQTKPGDEVYLFWMSEHTVVVEYNQCNKSAASA